MSENRLGCPMPTYLESCIDSMLGRAGCSCNKFVKLQIDDSRRVDVKQPTTRAAVTTRNHFQVFKP